MKFLTKVQNQNNEMEVYNTILEKDESGGAIATQYLSNNFIALSIKSEIIEDYFDHIQILRDSKGEELLDDLTRICNKYLFTVFKDSNEFQNYYIYQLNENYDVAEMHGNLDNIFNTYKYFFKTNYFDFLVSEGKTLLLLRQNSKGVIEMESH